MSRFNMDPDVRRQTRAERFLWCMWVAVALAGAVVPALACKSPPVKTPPTFAAKSILPVAIVSWPRPECQFSDYIPDAPDLKPYVSPGNVGLEIVYVTKRNLEDVVNYNALLRHEVLALRRCLGRLVRFVDEPEKDAFHPANSHVGGGK